MPYCPGQALQCLCWGSWQCVPYPNGSPIIIDTTGHGFHLTSAQNGVRFDIFGDGTPVQIAWTDSTSGNAFLALDRDGDGMITSGAELFGNFTEQLPSDTPNGFVALAEFDEPENGGNGNGIIDSKDRVYPKLLLWIDANHNGVSEPRELHSLPELEVYSLSLDYRSSMRQDQFGNLFRYSAELDRGARSQAGHLAYDVFLATTPLADGETPGPQASDCVHKKFMESLDDL